MRPSRSRRFPASKKHASTVSSLHVCWLCGKSFLSRYYLDLHIENSHKNDERILKQDLSSMMICPEKHICPGLGGQRICNRQAIEDEPYYARGGLDDKRVKHAFQKIINRYPCHEDQMKLSRQSCYEMFSNCFEGNNDLIEDLNKSICLRQTCQDHLHRLVKEMPHVHHFKEVWHHHSTAGSGLIRIFLVLLALIIFYGGVICGCWGDVRFFTNVGGVVSWKRKKKRFVNRKKFD